MSPNVSADGEALELMPSPATCHWGVFDSRIPPVMEIGSGDRVTIHTISGGADVTPGPDSGFTIPPELLAVQREVPRPTVGGGHILTAPIAARDAKPGAVLAVRIRSADGTVGTKVGQPIEPPT